MCIAAAAIPVASLAISAVSSAASIGMGLMSQQQQAAQAQASLNAQAQQARAQQEAARNQMVSEQARQAQAAQLQRQQSADSYNLQVAQTNAQMLQSYENQVRQTNLERKNIYAKNAVDRLGYQRSVETYQQQVKNNQVAANRSYMAEQNKLDEVRRKAAFEQQAALAKSIGVKGNILASGRTGQSIGLIVNDADRQAGFQQAQASATIRSARAAAGIGMGSAAAQAESSNNQAFSQIGFFPGEPALPEYPDQPNYIDGTTFEIQSSY